MAKKNKLLKDVFVTDTGKPYLRYETKDVGDIEFASITGKGIKLDTKNKYMSYKVSMIIPKAEAKRINDIREALWDEYKPKGAKKKPANELVYKHENGNIYINPHCATEFDDKQTVIGIVDCDGEVLDPEVYGRIGKGSTGYLSVNFTVYAEGVSMYLNSVQIMDFVPYAGGSGDGSGNFSKKEGKGLSGEKKFSKKSKKGKKKKSKK